MRLDGLRKSRRVECMLTLNQTTTLSESYCQRRGNIEAPDPAAR